MQISEIMNLIDENKLNEVGKLYKIDKGTVERRDRYGIMVKKKKREL
ncbi:hypothetical protein [Candidatus Tisiphia endosymbiont of Dioctria rufipes]